MSEHTGRRRNVPGDPTSEPESDPVPTGEDVVVPEHHQDELPETRRRYDEPANDVVMPADDSRLNTKI